MLSTGYIMHKIISPSAPIFFSLMVIVTPVLSVKSGRQDLVIIGGVEVIAPYCISYGLHAKILLVRIGYGIF